MYTGEIKNWMFRNRVPVKKDRMYTEEEVKFIVENAVPHEVIIKYSARIIDDYFETSSAEKSTHIAILSTKQTGLNNVSTKILYVINILHLSDEEIAEELARYYLSFCEDIRVIYNPSIENWIEGKDHFEFMSSSTSRISLQFIKLMKPLF